MLSKKVSLAITLPAISLAFFLGIVFIQTNSSKIESLLTSGDDVNLASVNSSGDPSTWIEPRTVVLQPQFWNGKPVATEIPYDINQKNYLPYKYVIDSSRGDFGINPGYGGFFISTSTDCKKEILSFPRNVSKAYPSFALSSPGGQIFSKGSVVCEILPPRPISATDINVSVVRGESDWRGYSFSYTVTWPDNKEQRYPPVDNYGVLINNIEGFGPDYYQVGELKRIASSSINVYKGSVQITKEQIKEKLQQDKNKGQVYRSLKIQSNSNIPGISSVSDVITLTFDFPELTRLSPPTDIIVKENPSTKGRYRVSWSRPSGMPESNLNAYYSLGDGVGSSISTPYMDVDNIDRSGLGETPKVVNIWSVNVFGKSATSAKAFIPPGSRPTYYLSRLYNSEKAAYVLPDDEEKDFKPFFLIMDVPDVQSSSSRAVLWNLNDFDYDICLKGVDCWGDLNIWPLGHSTGVSLYNLPKFSGGEKDWYYFSGRKSVNKVSTVSTTTQTSNISVSLKTYQMSKLQSGGQGKYYLPLDVPYKIIIDLPVRSGSIQNSLFNTSRDSYLISSSSDCKNVVGILPSNTMVPLGSDLGGKIVSAYAICPIKTPDKVIGISGIISRDSLDAYVYTYTLSWPDNNPGFGTAIDSNNYNGYYLDFPYYEDVSFPDYSGLLSNGNLFYNKRVILAKDSQTCDFLAKYGSSLSKFTGKESSCFIYKKTGNINSVRIKFEMKGYSSNNPANVLNEIQNYSNNYQSLQLFLTPFNSAGSGIDSGAIDVKMIAPELTKPLPPNDLMAVIIRDKTANLTWSLSPGVSTTTPGSGYIVKVGTSSPFIIDSRNNPGGATSASFLDNSKNGKYSVEVYLGNQYNKNIDIYVIPFNFLGKSNNSSYVSVSYLSQILFPLNLNSKTNTGTSSDNYIFKPIDVYIYQSLPTTNGYCKWTPSAGPSKTFTNNAPFDVKFMFDGTVDDEFTVNGKIIDKDKFPFTGAKPGNACNGNHLVSYSQVLKPDEVITLGSLDRFGVVVGLQGTVKLAKEEDCTYDLPISDSLKSLIKVSRTETYTKAQKKQFMNDAAAVKNSLVKTCIMRDGVAIDSVCTDSSVSLKDLASVSKPVCGPIIIDGSLYKKSLIGSQSSVYNDYNRAYEDAAPGNYAKALITFETIAANDKYSKEIKFLDDYVKEKVYKKSGYKVGEYDIYSNIDSGSLAKYKDQFQLLSKGMRLAEDFYGTYYNDALDQALKRFFITKSSQRNGTSINNLIDAEGGINLWLFRIPFNTTLVQPRGGSTIEFYTGALDDQNRKIDAMLVHEFSHTINAVADITNSNSKLQKFFDTTNDNSFFVQLDEQKFMDSPGQGHSAKSVAEMFPTLMTGLAQDNWVELITRIQSKEFKVTYLKLLDALIYDIQNNKIMSKGTPLLKTLPEKRAILAEIIKNS